MLFAKPVIVTVEFPKVPLAMVATPDPSEVRLLLRALIDTRVPSPLSMSGLALGKDVSLSIGTNPPISSTISVIRASIADVVAILVLDADHVSSDLISFALPIL